MIRVLILLAILGVLIYVSLRLATTVMKALERQTQAKEKAAKALEELARKESSKNR
jgi:type II secretory pathway component PulJ